MQEDPFANLLSVAFFELSDTLNYPFLYYVDLLHAFILCPLCPKDRITNKKTRIPTIKEIPVDDKKSKFFFSPAAGRPY